MTLKMALMFLRIRHLERSTFTMLANMSCGTSCSKSSNEYQTDRSENAPSALGRNRTCLAIGALMAKILYCWRCRLDVAMLDEGEWADLHPYLTKFLENVQEYRAVHGASLSEAKREIDADPVLQRYFELT